jgi:hypothetical protein
MQFRVCLSILIFSISSLAWGQFIGKDRILFPYASIHRNLGVLAGLWYEDIRWWQLQHRIRVRALAGFDGGFIINMEQNVPYPTKIGLYHRHSYITTNDYRVRYFNGKKIDDPIAVEGQYQGELALYYRPSSSVLLLPGVTVGSISQSLFQNTTQEIFEIAAQLQVLVGKQSFHPESIEGFIDMEFLRLLNEGNASKVEVKLGGQMPWLDPDWVVGSQIRIQWASEIPEFWFFRPYLGGVGRVGSFYSLSIFDSVLGDMNLFTQWRVYEGGLFWGWVQQVSLIFTVEGGMPLTPNNNEFWDSVSLGASIYLKNERRVQIQAAISPTHNEFAFSLSAKQKL